MAQHQHQSHITLHQRGRAFTRIKPGQFQCKNAERVAEGEDVRGDFRIWNSMILELLHPVNGASDEDLKPPVVTRQELLGDPVSGNVQATLAAKDESGIREIIALIGTVHDVTERIQSENRLVAAFNELESDA